MLVRPLMTNFKVTVRDDYAVSACSSSTKDSVYKSFHPLLVVGEERGVGLWTHVRHLYAQLPASGIKQTFLSTNLACLLAFEQ